MFKHLNTTPKNMKLKWFFVFLGLGMTGVINANAKLDFETDEATWMAVDISADNKSIVFDLLGDIYKLNSQGGQATPLITGTAYETQPVFSPDGQQIAFVSDRSGSNNLWIANNDGTGLIQLSHDDGMMIYSSPSWSPDGQYVYVSKTPYSLLAFEVFMFNKNGGTGIAITKAQPTGTENFDQRSNILGAVSSPDNKYLYYAKKIGTTWTGTKLPHWKIVRRDQQSGEETTIISANGGAMSPAISHDGRLLVYASRYGLKTGLRLRNLTTGKDNWLTFPIDFDGQEGGYYQGLVPRFTFTSDDKALVLSINGKISKLDIASQQLSNIPFTAHVQQELGQQTRITQHLSDGKKDIRIIQSPRISPDGKSVVYSALGQLYIQALDSQAKPVLLKQVKRGAFQPSWSADGKQIVYVSWSALDGGHVWTVLANNRQSPKQITKNSDYYTDPIFSPDGKSIITLRANQLERLHKVDELGNDVAKDLIELHINNRTKNSTPRFIAHAFGAKNLYFANTPKQINFYSDSGINSINLDTTKLQTLISVKALSFNQYFRVPLPVEDLKISPDGKWVLAKTGSQLYLLDVPVQNGKQTSIVISNPTGVLKKLTKIGVDDFEWSLDGKQISWSLGNSLQTIAFEDIEINQQVLADNKTKKYTLAAQFETDKPSGAILLRGATAITMDSLNSEPSTPGRGGIIESADILVVENKIQAIGKSGSIRLPKNVEIRDVSGKFITPGFVDTHAHWFNIQREIIDTHSQWNFLANLAYGVTSGLDVQTFTTDTFIYQDLIDAGIMPGPRAFSTGPGVFVNSNIDSEQAAIDVLTRYKEYYRTVNIKSYMVGDRAVRQYVLEAARKLGMMPTTEGATNLTLNITHALDGYAGNEHNLPISPLHKDIVTLFAKSRTAYNPTFTVLYGGWPALNDMIAQHHPLADTKLSRFMPPYVIENKTRVTKHWSRTEDQSYPRFAKDALNIQRAGGLVGIGSHGEMQGIGYHWEMQAYSSGGATPLEVLTAATINSSEIIGHQADIGSLTAGKYADLLIMDKDPLENIQNTQSIEHVMKNGRLYEANTLNEVWPRQQPLADQWFWHQTPPSHNSQ